MQLMCICFYAIDFGHPRIKKKCMSHRHTHLSIKVTHIFMCTLHAEISVVQNRNSVVNLFCFSYNCSVQDVLNSFENKAQLNQPDVTPSKCSI